MLKSASALGRGSSQPIRTSVAPDRGFERAATLASQLDLDLRLRESSLDGAPDIAEVRTLLRREHARDRRWTIRGESSGAYDHGHLAPAPLHLTEKSHSVEVRHAEVKDDDVGSDTIEGSQGVEPIDRLEHFEVPLETHPVESAPRRIVVNQQHLCHG